MKSSMMQATHGGMIIIATCLPDRQEFHSLSRRVGMAIKIKLQTHEIEHEENVTQWDDYNCEIPPVSQV